MMDHKIDKLISAIGDMNTAYLEEAIAFDGAKVGQQKAVRSKKLSAALVAALVILGLSVTAFAISRIPLSWRDIFSTSQTVIGDEDEEPVVSQQAAATEELQIKLEKVISDERTLYILYSVKANDGAVLDPKGQFAELDLYFPGQMMSGAYVSYFLERRDGVPENELEGVVLADWQPSNSVNGLVIGFSDWQEKPLDSEALPPSCRDTGRSRWTKPHHHRARCWRRMFLAYGGETLQVKGRVLRFVHGSLFDSYVDSTADNWTLEIFDANGDLIPVGLFIAAQTDDSTCS